MVMFHAEDPQILDRNQHQPSHEERRPPEAEVEAIRSILEVCKQLEIHPHIAHLSTADGLSLIEAARQDGQVVTTEVAPHHLAFDIENRSSYLHGEWLQMNPPLRSPRNRQALLEGLISGSIDCIATDHAPHSLDENAAGISGVPLLDTFGGFLCHLAAEGIPWPLLVERASTTPARLFSPFMEDQMGDLQPGTIASLSIVDLRQEWKVSRDQIRSRAGWSPFEGFTFPGDVIETVVRGRRFDSRTGQLIEGTRESI